MSDALYLEAKIEELEWLAAWSEYCGQYQETPEDFVLIEGTQ